MKSAAASIASIVKPQEADAAAPAPGPGRPRRLHRVVGTHRRALSAAQRAAAGDRHPRARPSGNYGQHPHRARRHGRGDHRCRVERTRRHGHHPARAARAGAAGYAGTRRTHLPRAGSGHGGGRRLRRARAAAAIRLEPPGSGQPAVSPCSRCASDARA